MTQGSPPSGSGRGSGLAVPEESPAYGNKVRVRTLSGAQWWVPLAAMALLVVACTAQPRTVTSPSGRPTATPIPTAPIYVNPTTRQPVWPTPPVWCLVSPVGDERPDLGPTMGEFPIWLVSRPLPVLPWRNELVRTVWVVDRSMSGDLVLTGRQTDGPALPQFIREGSGRATEQLVVSSAPRVGPTTASPTAARYADIQIYLSVPQPGCYDLSARIGGYTSTFTVYLYN